MPQSACLTLAELELWLRDGVSEPDRSRIREHLHGCGPCRQAMHDLRKEDADLRPVKPPFASELASRRLGDTIDTSPQGVVQRRYPRIDGYKITGVLGQGGMGIVYRAVQAKLNRAVALKVLPAMVGSANPSAVKRFRQEATAAARLHHTNIVPIYDFGESHDAYYYAMELIEGQPLNTLIHRFAEQNVAAASQAHLSELIGRGATFAPAPSSTDDPSASPSGVSSNSGTGTSAARGRAYFLQAARWIADAADALHYAHAQGIIHRDVKPANLILAFDGRIMITDFGLAKISEGESVTVTGSLLGTIRYLSPEQAMAKRIPIDHRSDIYSLGATMYELLCFIPAFPGLEEKQILAAIITRDPTRPRKLNAAVPEALENICMKALEKAPDDRYATARTLADDLRRFLEGRTTIAERPSLFKRTVRFVKRNKAPVIAAVTAVLMVATAGFYASERQSSAIERERSRAGRIRAHISEGGRLVDAGSPEAALKEFEAALAENPMEVRAHMDLAIAKKDLFNKSPDADPRLLDEAQEHIDRALELDRSLVGLWNVKGVLCKMTGRYDEAVAAYENQLKGSPGDVYTLTNLAAVNAMRQRLDLAEENLKQAAANAAAPQSGQPLCDPHRDLAMLYWLQRREAAVQAIERARTCNPKDEWTHLVFARILLSLPGYVDFDRARTEASIADETGKEEDKSFRPVAKRVLALAQLRAERWTDAVESARKAVNPKDAATSCTSQLIIAIAETRRGNRAAAAQALQATVAAWPEELKEPGAYIATAPTGHLWIDTADELIQLRNEAQALLVERRSDTP